MKYEPPSWIYDLEHQQSTSKIEGGIAYFVIVENIYVVAQAYSCFGSVG
jgi:hypothetical protein